MRRFCFLLPALFLCLVSCMKQDDSGKDTFTPVKGLFVLNNGQFGYSNASLSLYDLEIGNCQSGIFSSANDIPLGDTAQSMTIHGNTGWIVVNNSHVIYAVDLANMKIKGQVTGITSPRYIHFVSDTKAYVTCMNSKSLAVINPKTYKVEKTIEIGYEINNTDWEGNPVTTQVGGEQMIEKDGYLYVNLWSYGKEIVKIDLSNDNVVDKLEVGVQPKFMSLDSDGKLWVMTDGGYEGNVVGWEEPVLCKVDLKEFEIETVLKFEGKSDWKTGVSSPSNLLTNGDGRTLYWLRDGVWKMDISSSVLPSKAFGDLHDVTAPYALTINPNNGEVFVGDAKDYTQNGKVYRYSSAGELLGSFDAGVCPCFFCWY